MAIEPRLVHVSDPCLAPDLVAYPDEVVGGH